MGWIKKNLFSTWLNSLLTLVSLLFLWVVLPPLTNWLFWDANWQGLTHFDCDKPGACWPFIIERIDQFMYGFYPESERYRVNMAGVFLALLLGQWFLKRWSLISKVITTLVLSAALLGLLLGGSLGLKRVPTELWGGLSLTVLLSFGSILCAFPIAIVLALGRQSALPIVKSFCILFIELVRGVPLITVLYMASVMLPMFLPQTWDLNKLLRAFLGISFFQAAYLAEVIRGGLNAIPSGQYEASKALGLSYWPMMTRVVLPQALKVMIPGIVNTFIALFKDTTLVMIIGLFDFLGIVQAATTDPKWLGSAFEGYVFCAAVYWIFCYSMSKTSQRLEIKLGKSS